MTAMARRRSWLTGGHWGENIIARRVERWNSADLQALAADWREYFAAEPQAEVEVAVVDRGVELDVKVCPAIKHLHDQGRDIVPYFCEHCDHVCGAMAEAAGYVFQRCGGSGSCRQRFRAAAAANPGDRLMLGCQDFCGYYDWTFHFVRRSLGPGSRPPTLGRGDRRRVPAALRPERRARRAPRPLPAVDQDRRRGIVRLDIHAG